MLVVVRDGVVVRLCAEYEVMRQTMTHDSAETLPAPLTYILTLLLTHVNSSSLGLDILSVGYSHRTQDHIGKQDRRVIV